MQLCMYLFVSDIDTYHISLISTQAKITLVQERPSAPEKDQPSAQIKAPTCYFSIHREIRMRQARCNMQKGICSRQCIYIFTC